MKRAVLIVFICAVPALAQQPSPTADAGQTNASRLRYQVQVMERVLEQAVQHGARTLGDQMQSLTPSVLLFAGPVRARGFHLDGYGLFFDVEVPALRESVTWSFQILNQRDLGLDGAIASIRQYLQTVGDTPGRMELERVLKQLEGQVGPGMRRDADPRRTSVGPQGARPSPAPIDPVDTYTSQVKSELIEAVLDHGSGIALASDEWLTVAARDASEDLVPGELYKPATIMLRVRGRDLAALRTGQLTRDETRKRVEEVREF